MAVNQLTAFSAVPSPYGGIIRLQWTYDATLPTNWKLYVFKKRESNPTDTDIDSYLAGTLNDDQLREKGLYVFRTLPVDSTFKSIFDLAVLNNQAYYYRAIVWDVDASERSPIVDATATVVPDIRIHSVDGKRVVSRCFEKVFDTLKSNAGTQVSVPKDIRVFETHPRREQMDVFLVVQRTSGQMQERYLDSFVSQYQDGLVRGEMDIDVMSVEWIAVGRPEKRDKLTNIIRAIRLLVRHYILKMGGGAIKDVRFVMMGDSEGDYNGEYGHRGMMNVALITEQQLQIGSSITVGEWTTVITDVEGE